jgi:hypothetical protein
MSGLDFWIGDWDAAWDGGTGRNTVNRELDDRVVVERFEAAGEERFSGLSLSVPDPAGRWRQTWADSAGNYWAFVGGPQDDGSFVFATPEPLDAELLFKRMVFFNIADDSFDWRWEVSRDAEDWTQRWVIEYRRR